MQPIDARMRERGLRDRRQRNPGDAEGDGNCGEARIGYKGLGHIGLLVGPEIHSAEVTRAAQKSSSENTQICDTAELCR